ncbi:MAG: pyridoxal-phosphate dependent enzyme [Halioglobus sp.]|nr:pyridoxal-phosphate dependent enzyme [Halioglobus sp.]
MSQPANTFERPLLTMFPELRSQIAIENIASLPTPVESLSFSEHAWIKRDDLTHEEYGGNKIRKLEFIVADAIRKNAKRIITVGAIGTNHGVATAMVCQQFGLECIVYLFDQPLKATVTQNLRLMQAYGARLIYKGSLFKAMLAYYSSPYRLQSGSYFLFAGGSNLYGTLGFVNAACELQLQIEQGDCPPPSAIVCAVGSGATLAGLAYGCQLVGLEADVIGVRVAPKKLGPIPACTPGTVYQLMMEAWRFLENHCHKAIPRPAAATLLDDYYGDGYGVATEKGLQALKRFKAMGIALEQTYTAKAAAAFLDQLERNRGPVLFWDTYNSRDMTARYSNIAPGDLPRNLPESIRDATTGHSGGAR